MLMVQANSAKPQAVGAIRAEWDGSRSFAWQHGLLRTFEPGQEIYAEGEAAGTLYTVVRGVVRTCRYLGDGRRLINAFYTAGEVFGLESGELHHLTAEAVNDCAVTADRNFLQPDYALSDQRRAATFVAHVLRRAGRAEQHALLLGRRGATDKLATFLLEQEEGGDEPGVIELVMSRQDIADYLGLTIETVSRTMTQLERDGLITLASPRRILVTSMKELRALAE